MRTLLSLALMCMVCLFPLLPIHLPAYGAPGSQQLAVGVPYDVTDLDIRFHVGSLGKVMLDLMYEPLITYDRHNNLVPDLATEWKWIKPTQLQLKLRTNVRFHNGERFTARDVKFTLETMVDPALKSRNRPFLSEVKSVDVVDDETAIINTDAPSRGLIRQLTYYGLIVPHDSKIPGATGVELSKHPVGTGPYRFVSYSPGERLILERNPDYWGSKPGLDRVVFRIISDDGTRVAGLQAGELQFAFNVPLSVAARLEQQKNLAVDTRPTSRVVFLGIRVDRAPMSDVRVRQAVAHAINIDLINKKVFNGKAIPAQSVLAPNIWGYAPMKRYNYDPARARALLKEANAEGAPIRLMGPVGGFLNDKDVTETIGGYLQAAGFKVDLNVLEWATFLNTVFIPDRAPDLWLQSWGVNSLNADMLMTAEFHSKRGRDLYHYHNAELDRLIDQARAELDDGKAKALYQQVQATLWRDLPWVPLYVQPDTVGYARNLGGWFRTQGDDYVRFSQAYLK